MTESVIVPTEKTDEPEHRASWLELFFDLVVVVAIATLTERLHEHADGAAMTWVLIMYGAIWLVWTSFMLYANIAADKTHRRAMLLAMGCIAVMAAAVPHADDPARGRIFAIAYIVARLIASRTWRDTNRVLVDWPIAQLSFGLLPWIISVWAHEPVRYYLWGAGLLIDLVFSIALSDNPQAILKRVQDEYNRARRNRGPKPDRGRRRNAEPAEDADRVTYEAVDVDQSHFGERLGTFTIIVLGEVVTQIVMSASNAEWSIRFDMGAVAAFLFIFGLWWLTFQYSAYTEKDSEKDALPTHIALPLHFLTTAAIMLMASGLGELVLEPDKPLGTGLRWLLGGGLAGYLMVNQAALAFTRWARPWWLALLGVVVIAAPLLLAGFGAEIHGWVFAVAVTLIVGVQVTFRKIDAGRRGRPDVSRHLVAEEQ